MGYLSLELLGPPHIRHGGRALTFSTRKTLALLVYLKFNRLKVIGEVV